MLPKELREQRAKSIAEYLKTLSSPFHGYIIKYMIFEIVTVIFVVVFTCYMAWFIDFKPWRLQDLPELLTPALTKRWEDRNDPLVQIFPRAVSCTSKRFGPSLTEENIDALCTIPNQVFNEIFIVVSLYVGIFAIIGSMLNLMHFTFTYTYFIHYLSLYINCTPKISPSKILILMLLHQNVDLLTFKEVMSHFKTEYQKPLKQREKLKKLP